LSVGYSSSLKTVDESSRRPKRERKVEMLYGSISSAKQGRDEHRKREKETHFLALL
jgi:hypothetical protein